LVVVVVVGAGGRKVGGFVNWGKLSGLCGAWPDPGGVFTQFVAMLVTGLWSVATFFPTL
jgi:hypothetical protein